MYIEESGLQFDFSETWVLKKYDASRFYLMFSGRGYSAVDFVGLWQGKVVLIEVKNYRYRPDNQLEYTQKKLLGDVPPLIETFEEKVEESLMGISAISTYFHRKCWYRQSYKWLKHPHRRHRLLRNEGLYWMYLDELIKSTPEKVQFVLWLELPDSLAHYRASFEWALQQQFRKDKAGIALACHRQHPFGNSLKVKFS